MDEPNLEKLNELLSYVNRNKDITRFEFLQTVRSVQEAIDVSRFEKSEFIKSICLKHKNEDWFVVAIIPASARVDKKALMHDVNPKKWNMASPEEIYQYTGFPAGGVPPICINDTIKCFVDPRVLAKRYVVGGGGTQQSLIRLPSELIVQNGAEKKIVSFG